MKTRSQESLERRRQQMLALGWHRQEVLKNEASGCERSNSLPTNFPGSNLWEGQSVIHHGGRSIRLLSRMRDPWLAVLSNVLGRDECEALIDLAKPRLKRSEIINTGDKEGSAIASYTRTSQSTFISTHESDLVAEIERRVADLLCWPVDNFEHMQIVRYGVGADFVPHHDYFETDLASTDALVQQGGNRIASFLLYLNTPSLGGSTLFSDVELDVLPRCGSALYFAYPMPDESSSTLHSGAPVLKGEKWLATFFVRQSLMHRRPRLPGLVELNGGRNHE